MLALLAALSLDAIALAAADPSQDAAWRERLLSEFGARPAQAVARAIERFPADRQRLKILADWIAQDRAEGRRWPGAAIRQVLDELGPAADGFRAKVQSLGKAKVPADDPRWAALYLAVCEKRRAARLDPHRDKLQRVVFTKHYDLGGSHYAYTEGQSDAQHERHFEPGSSLCVLEMNEGEMFGKVRTLLSDPGGVIRDPDVSYDGQRILVAWKKSLDEDDYHLYEMSVGDGSVRQLTFGLGYADYEGAYLPSGEILFNSTRCVQTVDCWWTEVSNLFTCDRNGRFLRQLSFDQVHTNFPTVTHDGRVVYTRWDYHDRGQIYPQGLFQMSPDGRGQTEVYGNNSWFPTTILHARMIPGTSQIVCIFTGHHTLQQGWLGILDPRRGRQENQGAQLIAPVRDTPAVHVDEYGQTGDQFQYPYPLSETAFLVAVRPDGAPRFGVYVVTIDGQRELLASDPAISCNQPIPLCARPVPPIQPSRVDYRQAKGTLYVQDVYRGPGLAGIERGTIKALRVVALEFRAAGIGENLNKGPAGDALASTPVSIQGAWDVKRVLGTVEVYHDGSACFTVPARTPLYFQALDAKGQMVQSMRSWVSLQPGETASCVGCHEHKNTAPPVTRLSQAMAASPQEPTPFYGPARGFSFIEEIQPILDRHCVRCHDLDEPPRYAATQCWLDRGDPASPGPAPEAAPPAAAGQPADAVTPAFSLKGTQVLEEKSLRKWSDAYLALADRGVCNWINIQSAPPMLPPYHAGASQSRLIRLLEDSGHYGVRLSQPELDRLIVWIDLLVPYCGDYTEAMAEEKVPLYHHYLEKRRRWQAEEARNIDEYLGARPQ